MLKSFTPILETDFDLDQKVRPWMAAFSQG
jgi:hypothetical protein